MKISTSPPVVPAAQLRSIGQPSQKRSTWQRLSNRLVLHAVAIVLPVALFASTAQAAAYIVPGDQGNSVITLQQRLNQLGYRVSVDGRYGYETEQAVRAFQSSHGLHMDGVVGEDTRLALDLLDSEAQVDYPNGIDNIGGADDFLPGTTTASADLGRKRFVVMIPTENSATLSKVREYFRGAAVVRTPLGPYIRVRNYASRSEAERLSKQLRNVGFRDAHVRHL